MEECFRCEKNGKEVRLLDAIYENDIVKICERCAIIEDIPIIRKPTTLQLKESERASSVYERLKRLSGLKKEQEKEKGVLEQIKNLDDNPELERPEINDKPFSLIDNFHWYVTRARRNRGLSQKQLAWMIGESETAVKMIEKAELPEDPEKLIRKLEQFFQIKLRERTSEEIIEEQKKREESLKEKSKLPEVEEGIKDVPIEPIINEPKIKTEEIMDVTPTEPNSETELERENVPTRILSFKSEALDGITIADLKKIKEEKERDDRMRVLEEERKKTLGAEEIVEGLEKSDQEKAEFMAKVAKEMKDAALGKEKLETIEEKRRMLNKAVKKVSKAEEKEKIPTISELIERKQEKKQENLIGNEIELAEEESKV